MVAEVVDFKGKPIMKITEEGMRYPLQFGLTKAKLILKYLMEIEQFVEEKGAEK